MEKELENKTKEEKRKEMEDKKELQKYLDGIKVYDDEIPKLNEEYTKEDFIPKVDKKGMTKWEKTEQDVWDYRGFTLLKVENVMDIISTAGLTSIVSMNKALNGDFEDVIEDLYSSYPKAHWEKIVRKLNNRRYEATQDFNLTKANFYSDMIFICIIIMKKEDKLDRFIDIYTIKNILFELIEQLSKLIGIVSLKENLENLLIKEFNKSKLNKLLLEILNKKYRIAFENDEVDIERKEE